jgi:hypothetical protein
VSGELTFFVAAAIVYVAECCVWCDPDATVFAGWRRGAWRVRRAAFVPLGDRGGFWIAPILPPFHSQVRCDPWPLALGREGVDVAGQTLLYDEIAGAHVDGRSIVFTKAIRVQTASARTAGHLLEVVRRIATLDPDRRIGVIRGVLRSAFNSVQARKALKQFQDAVSRLRLASHVLFWYVFALAPIVVWQFGLASTWIVLLAGLAALTCVTVASFVLAHRRLNPDRRQDRLSQALMLAIAPIAAIRAVDRLAWFAFADYHPLAVAAVLADRGTFVHAARRDRFDAARLARQFEGSASASWYKWTLEEIDGCLDRYLAREETLEAPRADDGSSRSYCPRCGDQYVADKGRCAGCEDVELIPFAAKDS